MEHMYYVYLVECVDKTFYIGCTNNLEKRIREHNVSKNGAHYTKIRRPVILKYYEKHLTLLAARGRETALKKLTRSQKEDLIKDFLSDTV